MFVTNVDVIAFYLTTSPCSGSVFIKQHSGFDFVSQNVGKVVTCSVWLH